MRVLDALTGLSKWGPTRWGGGVDVHRARLACASTTFVPPATGKPAGAPQAAGKHLCATGPRGQTSGRSACGWQRAFCAGRTNGCIHVRQNQDLTFPSFPAQFSEISVGDLKTTRSAHIRTRYEPYLLHAALGSLRVQFWKFIDRHFP
jgi:hypothetical protein